MNAIVSYEFNADQFGEEFRLFLGVWEWHLPIVNFIIHDKNVALTSLSRFWE